MLFLSILQPFYWSRENGGAKVDFLCQAQDAVIPIEVKAKENLQAKSLKVYCSHFHPPFSVRTSMSDYRTAAWTIDGHSGIMINLPLYAIDRIRKECGDFTP